MLDFLRNEFHFFIFSSIYLANPVEQRQIFSKLNGHALLHPQGTVVLLGHEMSSFSPLKFLLFSGLAII
jgi:hypothetical protein